ISEFYIKILLTFSDIIQCQGFVATAIKDAVFKSGTQGKFRSTVVIIQINRSVIRLEPIIGECCVYKGVISAVISSKSGFSTIVCFNICSEDNWWQTQNSQI